jgi:hypothetical protein
MSPAKPLEGKKLAFVIIATGFALSLFAFVANGLFGATSARVAEALGRGIVLGNVIFMFGCIQLARAKGRPWYFGLLGILNCVGLLILWFFVKERPQMASDIDGEAPSRQ